MFGKSWHSYGPLHLDFLYILACLLISYILAMDLSETWQGCCTTNLEVHVGK